MPTKSQTSALAIIFVLSYLGILHFQGMPQNIVDITKQVSTISGIFAMVIFVFHFFLWKYLPLWFVAKPNINGTWVVDIKFVNSEEPIRAFMVVNQKYFTLSMRLESKITSSEIEAEKIVSTKSDNYRIYAIYFCENLMLDTSKNEHHRGAMILTYKGNCLEGKFWTELYNGGSLNLHSRMRKRYDDFNSAHNAYIAQKSQFQ